MIFVILASFVPLVFKHQTDVLRIIDHVTVGIFIIDYLVRWVVSSLSEEKSAPRAVLTYPLQPMAIIDLLSILPSIVLISPAFKALRVLRLIRALRVFRIIRYSKNIRILVNVLRKQRQSLTAVGCLAVGYIFISAIVIFQIEPNTFDDFFDAVYWATVSLTTVGYGDIFATSDIGRLITMISAFMGIAIVALPAGIITAGYMDELNDRDK
jgi:voltage-gated potassium channel